MDRQVIGAKRKPTTVTHLNGHSSKLISLIYCYIHKLVNFSLFTREASFEKGAD